MAWALCRPRVAPIRRYPASPARAVTAFLWALVTLGALAARSTALIIDVNATVNNTANPVFVSLAAGAYSVTPVGISGGGAYDAWNAWGSTNCAVSTGCPQTIPTTFIGWKSSYDVVSDAITAVSVSGSPLAPVAAEQFGSYWLVSGSEPHRYHVDNETVYPAAPDALANAESSQFTVSTSGLVGFAIHDGFLNDNLGGMSLEVLQVPEASPAALLGLGLASLCLRRRVRRTPGW
jgi:hypothetical protein